MFYFLLNAKKFLKNAFKPLFFEQILSLACPNFTKNNLALSFSHTNRFQKNPRSLSYFVLELSRKNALKPLFFEQKSSLACPNFTKNNSAFTFSHTNRLQKTRGLYLTLFLSYQGKML